MRIVSPLTVSVGLSFVDTLNAVQLLKIKNVFVSSRFSTTELVLEFDHCE